MSHSASAQLAVGASGAVAAGHPHAARAALDVLRRGGNAIDAAIAGSAVQCVVEMPWCGVGGDAFAMIRTAAGEVLAFNGSGAAPTGIEAKVAASGATKVPRFGPLSIAVPGLVDTWTQLASRLGSRPLGELLAPAIDLAETGFAVDARLQHAFVTISAGANAGEGAELPTLLCDPFRQVDLARTLALIAATGRDGFYAGTVAEQMASHVQSLGGALTIGDLTCHRGEWCDPISVRYRDAVVHTQPPVSMGVLLLSALGLVERSSPEGLPRSDADLVDGLVAIKHTVFGAALAVLGDVPAAVNADALVSAEWLGAHAVARAGVGTLRPTAGGPDGSDTTTIAVADEHGTIVSLIHSLFNEFGSRVLVPGTGIVLNDRLANVAADASKPNGLRDGRRPMHTLHSYIANLRDGTVLGGATPGGRGQVQTNLQVLLRLIDGRADLASAVGAPRWVNGMPRRSPDDDTLYVEPGFDRTTADELTARGHRVETIDGDADDHFGSCTIAAIRPDGARMACADHRRSASAEAF